MDNNLNIHYYEICDSCTECYWYDRKDEDNCDGEKQICNNFINKDE